MIRETSGKTLQESLQRSTDGLISDRAATGSGTLLPLLVAALCRAAYRLHHHPHWLLPSIRTASVSQSATVAALPGRRRRGDGASSLSLSLSRCSLHSGSVRVLASCARSCSLWTARHCVPWRWSHHRMHFPLFRSQEHQGTISPFYPAHSW